MRSYLTHHDLIAVSANQAETGINTFQTLDTSLMVTKGTMMSLERRTEDNANELNGLEEPDTIYDLGATASVNLEFEKAGPQHFAFLAAFALGRIATVAAGAGYQHTITPIAGDFDADRSIPSFTLGQRLGRIVTKERYASCFIDQITATFAKDAWVKLTGQCKATGKRESTVTEETISAAGNATTLTLDANGVHGATAEERLDNVQSIRAETASGVWEPVAFSVVSSATPAAITITAPGADADPINYRVLYIPTEPAWATFPARVTETPLRVSEAVAVLGGKWDGTAFLGGREMRGELSNVEWSFQNQITPEFTFGADGAYATRALRQGRKQTLKIDRDYKDSLFQQYLAAGEYMGFRVLAQGAEYETGHHYEVELIFPRVAFTNASRSDNSGRLAESGELTVLEDATYGSVIVRVKNLVSGYAG